MIRRRSFLIAGSGIAAAPVFAHLTWPAAARASAAVPAPVAQAPMADPGNVALRIDGWDSAADSTADAWVHINSSWRATWR